MPGQLGLPHRQTVRYAKTDNFRLFPTDDVAYADIKDPLAWVNYSFMSNYQDKIALVEGSFPEVAGTNTDSVVDVLVSEALAEEIGMQSGEQYMTFRRVETEDSRRTVQIPIRITGIWRAIDPNDEYWFYRQSVFDNQLVVPEDTFRNRLSTALDDEIAQILWYLIMDGAGVSSDDVNRLLFNINDVQQTTLSLLNDTRLEISPQDELRRYSSSARLLNVLLYAFSIPIVGLLLAFIGWVVGLSVARQRNEIAVLRSRGATVLQILGIALLEALLLAGVAIAAGIPTSQGIAQIIGATKSFLNFTVETDLRVNVTMSALRFGAGAIIVTLMAQVLPSIGASRETIVTYKQSQARTLKPPLWQRMWLDVMLLIPAVYGAYLLRQQGSVVGSGANGVMSGGLFDNPLLFLVPALAAFAMTLFILRILPIVMRFLAWIASRTTSVGFLLATRYLARDPGFYTAPLVLLILTLSLSSFTASLAQTLDTHLFDQSYYKVGADMRLVELGQNEDQGSTVPGGGGAADPAASTASDGSSGDDNFITGPRWVFVPVSEHLKVDEIQEATRVGEFGAGLQLQGRWVESVFIGVDRLDFPKVAFWRSDFAPASLGALMNSLAIMPDGILLPRSVMRANTIRVGDIVPVRISTFGQRVEANMTVVGEIDYFPTWYIEEEGPLIVGNLENVFEMAGGEVPYDVWVKTDTGGIDYEKVLRELNDLDLTVINWNSSTLRISDAQKLPERQGLFGVLSVGFLSAALLTVLGFLLYALFSFRRRFIELGTLRAMGLSSGQMTAFLAWELAFLILLGLGAGTILGSIISQAFIPYLQVGTDAEALTPPFQVQIAWFAILRIYALFGILFFFALSVLAVLLLRMKIFQAIKLGETV
ncbi:MAG: ABC transporter permease [Chloroflexota bacterium]